jgi:hypothetical protein
VVVVVMVMAVAVVPDGDKCVAIILGGAGHQLVWGGRLANHLSFVLFHIFFLEMFD